MVPGMSLVDEYRRQYDWRDWARALSLCPLLPGQHVLDLGCGPGDLAAELSARGASVTGIDRDAELLAVAKERCPRERFERQDLNSLDLAPGSYDGLWCGFAAAYFVNFERTFAQWSSFLKPEAWVCLIEIDDLLGHEPLPEIMRCRIGLFYEDALAQGRYDFRAGGKLESILKDQAFQVVRFELRDQELSFDGPARPAVLSAWGERLARMGGLKNFLGKEYPAFRDEFMSCLSARNHRSLCKVVCCVGTRQRA